MLWNFVILICFEKKFVKVFTQFGWLVVGLFWKERNNRVFSNQGVSTNVLLDKVKTFAWWWLKTRQNNFNFALSCWWVHPLACLRIRYG
jgi:hypothetical protein